MTGKKAISAADVHPAVVGAALKKLTAQASDVQRDGPKPKPDPNPGYTPEPEPPEKQKPEPVKDPAPFPKEEKKLPPGRSKDPVFDPPVDHDPKAGFNYSDWRATGQHTLEEHIICGYEVNGTEICRLILAEESDNGALRYTGHVEVHDHRLDALIIGSHTRTDHQPFHSTAYHSEHEPTWVVPSLSCVVECSEKTDSGLMLAPVYRGLKPSPELRLTEAPLAH